jgi:hypothetical protein
MATTPAQGTGYRRKGCRVSTSTGYQASITNATEITILVNSSSFAADCFDDDTMLDAVNHNIVVKKDGRYEIGGAAMFPASATGNRWLIVGTNSASYAVYEDEINTGAATVKYMAVSTVVNLVKNDTVHMRVMQNSGGAVTVSGLRLYVQEVG